VRRRFTARFRPELVTALDDVRRNLETHRVQVVDARSAGRFAGTEPEPRPGLRGGHIPGSLNLPYDRLFAPDGSLLPSADLRRLLEAARVDLDQPIVTTCGSGVTACVLALGLHLVGRPDVAVYDGSWTEWGGRGDVPVERRNP
jgi:thiosulfate/3-mercaptopyruvate sulfurtransferase